MRHFLSFMCILSSCKPSVEAGDATAFPPEEASPEQQLWRSPFAAGAQAREGKQQGKVTNCICSGLRVCWSRGRVVQQLVSFCSSAACRVCALVLPIPMAALCLRRFRAPRVYYSPYSGGVCWGRPARWSGEESSRCHALLVASSVVYHLSVYTRRCAVLQAIPEASSAPHSAIPCG
jgi:hypothetical protein